MEVLAHISFALQLKADFLKFLLERLEVFIKSTRLPYLKWRKLTKSSNLLGRAGTIECIVMAKERFIESPRKKETKRHGGMSMFSMTQSSRMKISENFYLNIMGSLKFLKNAMSGRT